jgi:lipopolysaccharide transport protein LptA
MRGRRFGRAWIGPLLAVLLGAAVGAEPEPGDAAGLALGVAPFEVDAPPDSAVPDIATRLATRLGEHGVQRVVGPEQLGASADADAKPAVVKQWASAAQVDGIVVGRTTRIGNQLSVDVRLRVGETGEVARTLIEQFQRPEDLDAGVDHLAGEVIAAAEGLLAEPEPVVEARAPAEPAAEGALEPGGDAPAPASAEDAAVSAGSAPAATKGNGKAPFGFDFGGGDQPLAIESDELEVVQKDGRRRLVFSKNVRVRQGDMQLDCAVLEAVYPDAGGEPSHMTARGNVRLAQREQRAGCDRLDYDRVNERLSCQGNAWFEDGENRLGGEVIDIDLRHEKVKVKGGARVVIQPEKKGQGGRES